MSPPLLEVEDLRTQFVTDDGIVKAVDGVSFTLEPGETLAIVGESGSGKSVTALSVMGLVEKPAGRIVDGDIRYRGRSLIGLPPREYQRLRGNELAMIFQDPMTSLNPVLRISDQLGEAMLVHGTVTDKAGARARAVELLEAVGIPRAAERVRDYPHQFSGGMRQRVMIAMAIANDPDVLIADEPTTALDVTIQAQIVDVLRQAQHGTGAAMILITHDLGLVAGVADRVVVLYGGRVMEQGELRDIYYGSRHPYTRGLMASVPRLDAAGAHRLTPIAGAPPSLIRPPSGCVFHPRCPHATERCPAEVPELRSVGPRAHRAACHYAEDLPDLLAAAVAARAEEEQA